MAELQEWQMRDFSGGMNDKAETPLLEDNQAATCQNVISNKIGVLTQRKGQTRLNAGTLGGAIKGLFAFYYGANRKLITVANGVAYYWDGAAWQSIKSGLDTSAQTYFEAAVNYMVAFNGVDAPWKYTGSAVTALANAPATGKFAVLYKEKLFTVDATDESTMLFSDSFEPETWTAVNYIDFGKGDGDIVTAAVNYLGAMTVFKNYSIYELAGTSLDDFRVQKLEGRVGCVGQRAVANYGMHLYLVAKDGIYQWNGSKATNLLADKLPHLWGAVIQQYLANAAVGVWDDKLWCSLTMMAHRQEDTDNTVAADNATDEATLVTLVNAIKTAYEAHRVEVNNYHYRADAANAVAAATATNLATAYTLVVELKTDFNAHLADKGHVADDSLNTVATANPSDNTDEAGCITLANAIKAKFNLHLTDATSTTNNFNLVYDLLLKSFWPWRGINASCFARYNDGTQEIFYSGDSTDGFVLTQDTGDLDVAATINAYWVGKVFDLGAPAHKKKFKKAFVTDSPDKNDVTFTYALDYGSEVTPAAEEDDGMLRRFPVGTKGRYFQPIFSHTTADQSFEVRGLTLTHKPKSKAK